MMVTMFMMFLVVFCTFVHDSFATVYYIKPSTGLDSNNGTSTSTPWKTFNHAKSKTCGGGSSACLAPGDTLRIMGGTYTPSQYKGVSGLLKWTQNDSLGTAGNPITITNNPGETVIFDGGAAESQWIMFNASVASYNGHYIVVDGTNKNIIFQNYAGVTLSLRGDSTSILVHHLAFLNTSSVNNLNGSHTATLMVWNARHSIFKNNLVNMNGIGGIVEPGAEHGLYLSEVSQNILFHGNVLKKIAGYGIHFYGHANYTDSNHHNIIRYNTVNNARNASVTMSGGKDDNTYVYNNTFVSDQIPRSDLDGNSSRAGLCRANH